jgi:hypothetical protein
MLSVPVLCAAVVCECGVECVGCVVCDAVWCCVMLRMLCDAV